MPNSSSAQRRIVIAHMYPDVMDLYGDSGNLTALRRRCEWRGIGVDVVPVRIGDGRLPRSTDLLLIGGGEDTAQALVAPDLARHASEIRDLVDGGAAALAVCGGFQLLGTSYEVATGEVLPGVGAFDAMTLAGPDRCIGNVMIETSEQSADTIAIHAGVELVGFENHAGRTHLGSDARPLGVVIHGAGNTGDGAFEGIVHRNAIGTYLHGPVLPKNPVLADGLIAAAIAHRHSDAGPLEPLDDDIECRAHRAAVHRTRSGPAGRPQRRLAG